MATIYTQRFVAARTSAAGSFPILTVPSTGRWVLRDIVVENLHGSAQVVGLFLTNTGLNYWLLRRPGLATGATEHLDLRQELLPGELISLSTDLGGATALLTGYVFTT